ncbi:hypothetical protein PG985_011380 [Apiospora marii]|uniref:uncharacterized protein n=1 Tax=Apiospora marii TaxID=335849 RepID=UPI0031302285
MSGELMQPSNMASSVLDKAVATNSTSANQFRFFQRLPPELRMMIWGYALDLEKEHKGVASWHYAVTPMPIQSTGTWTLVAPQYQ